MSDKAFFIIFAVIILLAFITGGLQLKAAIECGEKGGAYLTNTGSWPVCAKVEKL